MSFIRPEARATLLRWREVIAGGGLIALGAYWTLGVGGLLAWVGLVLVIAGAGLCVIGLQRMRFRTSGHGPGVVLVDEGEVTYMGPLNGGSVSMADLDVLILDPSLHPAHWVLTAPGQGQLHIPVNAEGSDALFDAFAGLPGIKTTRMLQQLNGSSPMPVVIWERNPGRFDRNRLH